MNIKQQFILNANRLNLGDLTKVGPGKTRVKLVNTIADTYLVATADNDIDLRDATISGLMLLFWGEIGKMAEKCKAVPDYEYDDFVSVLYNCIETAMQYHAWKDGKHNAEQCIRAAIASRGAAAILYESNLDKNKANINKTELDRQIGDNEDTILDTIEDPDSASFDSDLAVRSIVQQVINTGDIVGAIILDNIAFADSTKEIKENKVGIDEEGNEYKYTVSHSEFHEYRLVQSLANLPQDYIDYFMNRYSIKQAILEATIERIKTANNQKLYTFVRNTLTKQRAAMSMWVTTSINN